MSTEQNQAVENTETKSRVITCFVYYNSDEELSKIFETINDFRTRHGLKYSHHSGYIFFNLLSDHLNEFGKARPFRVSKYKTTSEYTCTKEVADKLMEKKNSFIRMSWNEDGIVVFNSRTIARVHSSLVYKIFRESGIEFSKDSYKVLKPEREQKDYAPKEREGREGREAGEPQETQKTDNAGFIKVEKKTNKYNSKPREKSQDMPKIRGKNNKK
jgi:hypothetical protein